MMAVRKLREKVGVFHTVLGGKKAMYAKRALFNSFTSLLFSFFFHDVDGMGVPT
jgi:hypothetical protein